MYIQIMKEGINMDKKICFFDFDDTLRIGETDEITKATYASFQRLKEIGHILFLNTGRSFNALGPQVYTLPFDGFICGCGTYIRYQDKVLLEAQLPGERMQDVLDCLDTYKIDAIFEGHRGLYCNHVTSDYMKDQIEGIKTRGIEFLDTSDSSFHFVKMSLHYPNQQVRQQFETEMQATFDFIIRNDQETEVILKGYSKGTALRSVVDYFKMSLKDSYAFGDSNNDEEMLLAAGNSILIGDSAKHLVNKVNFVSKDAMHDGVTYALQQLKLLEE